MLKLDYSLLVQIANFLFLLFILNIIAYRPIRKILGRRQEEMDSAQKEIDGFQEQYARGEKDLQERIVSARREGMKERDGRKGEGLEEEKVMLQGAHASAEEKIEKAKEEIRGSLTAVRESLQSEVEGFSQQLVEKILGRSL